MTQAGVVGILALIILRETYQFVLKVRNKDQGNGRRSTDKLQGVKSGVDAVLGRMDRIIERLEDIADATRMTRKQVQITGELTERLGRQVDALDETITEVMAAHRRKTETQPNIAG
jgi:hypothetical protein